MKLSYLLAALALLAFLAVWQLSKPGNNQASEVVCDPQGWLLLPKEKVDEPVMPVARNEYVVLRGKLQEMAWRRLADASFYRLSEEEAAGAKIGGREGWPYFMRAVTFNPDKNDVLVGRRGGDYFVSHVGRGAEGAAMKCWPIMIFLKDDPASVFVHAWAAPTQQ